MNAKTASSPLPRPKLRVGFILADRFTLSAFASFADVLRLSADEDDKSRRIRCDWDVLSADMDMVRSSGGFLIQPDTPLRRARAYDYVVVVGGLIGDDSNLGPEARAFLADEAAKGTPLVGLCTGVFILQQAGLLQGYRCCVSWFHRQDFLDRFEAEHPVADQLFVVDRDRLTCSGGYGAAHLAAYLVARHIGQSTATKSLNIMMIDSALEGERPQPTHLPSQQASDPVVKRAVHVMLQNVELPLSIAAIARAQGIARRTLERRFLADLGATPQQHYVDLRLDRAIALLSLGTQSTADIALATGFCDASHLAKTLRARRGASPKELRPD